MCRASLQNAESIVRCLSLYGDASGQMINKQKSSIIFGSKVSDPIKQTVKSTLDIAQEGGEGTYLGLPEYFSGSKRHLLSFLCEKLQGRMNGWYAKSLSHGGKEVLLKSIGLGMPVFAMSVFKLPKDICCKLTSALVEFWWSCGSQKRKIPWIAWQKLCKPKSSGGLGFKDIEKFNQSLLAKQAWRVWSNPDSLLARILKQRYFKNGTILEACVGNRPSFAWRSMLFGRDLIKQGLLQSIGNGHNTYVWLDNWIMDYVPRPPRYHPDAEVNLTLKVSSLIDVNSGNWNERMVRQLFCPEDVPIILHTAISRLRTDSLVWCLTKEGVYSSKTGYILLEELQRMQNQQTEALPPLEQKLWTDMWKSKTTLKLRHFLWRALSGALAVRERLHTRGIPVNPLCPVCGGATESICHTLFNFPMACQVWSASSFPLPPGGFSLNSVLLNLHHLLSCSKNTSLPTVTRLSFPWVLWHIWKARNSFVFEGKQQSYSTIAESARSEASIWLTLHGLCSDPDIAAVHAQLNNDAWVHPPLDVLKCNVDVSWSERDGLIGVAWIVRNHEGITIFHSRRSYTGIRSRCEAELRALFWAVESLNHLRVRRIIFESPFILAREACLNPQSFPDARGLVLEIFSLLQPFHCWSFSRVLPHRNRVAAYIARSVTQDGRTQSYVAAGAPRWLDSILQAESLHT